MLSVLWAPCLARGKAQQLENPSYLKNCELFSDLWVCHSTCLWSRDLSPLCVLHPLPTTHFLFSVLSLALSKCLQPHLDMFLSSWSLAGASGQTSCFPCLCRVDWKHVNLWKEQSSKMTTYVKLSPCPLFIDCSIMRYRKIFWSLWSLLPCAVTDPYNLSLRQTWTQTTCEVQVMFSTDKLMLSLLYYCFSNFVEKKSWVLYGQEVGEPYTRT